MTVSSSTNKVSYAGNGALTTFAYTFKVFDEDDLTVILRASDGTETTQTITTHYTVTGVGSDGGGNVEFVTAPASGVTVVIVREQPLTQGLDLVPNDPFPAQSLEDALDKITFMTQRIEEITDRSLKYSVGDSVISSEIPSTLDIRGKVLAFDEVFGKPVAGPEIADIETVSEVTADIATLADIQDGTVATNAITIVSARAADIVSLAALSDELVTINSISSSITSLNGIKSQITTAATYISDISDVAGSIAQIQALGVTSAINNMATLAPEVADINTLAYVEDGTLATNGLSNLANNVAALLAVNSNSSNITTVAGIDTDVTTVAGISANVTTVAGITANIASVVADEADIGTVATNITNVNTVAGISSDVTTVAGQTTNLQNVTDNLSAIQNAAANATAAAASAAAAAASADTFDDTYLGSKASDPTVDNDGDPLNAGDLYFNTGSNVLKVYNGSSWAAAALDASGYITSAGGTLTADLSFGDSVKATFGASADLQIYHDGSNSYISDQGTGNLRILAEDFRVVNAANSETAIQANVDGDVRLYYDAALKLATTSTGVDITGTLTSDGLTVNSGAVDNTALFISSDASAFITFSDVNTTTFPQIGGQGNNLLLRTNNKKSVLIESNNDISFYEDTGTTAKFFWDASAERLGIGTSSPTQPVHLSSSSTAYYLAETTGTGTSAGIRIKGDASADYTLFTTQGTNQFAIYDNAAGSERMRIDSSGNVGIGTATVDQKLHLEDSSTGPVFLKTENTAGALLVGNNSSGNSFVSAQTTGKPLIFETQNTERMRIDSSGNVGIGTSSPAISSRLNVSSTTQALDSGGTILASVTDAIAADIGGQIMMGGYYTGTTTAAFGGLAAKKSNATHGNYDAYLQFLVSTNGLGNTEKMRIDSSGNLLVGTTSTATNDVGFKVFQSTGQTVTTASGTNPVLFNRKTSDGDIAVFRKDDITVGSIGSTLSGGRLTIDGTDGVNIQTFLVMDDAIYLGGTAAGNALDDYEEGTWTPTINSGTISATNARYVKVGSLVTVSANIGDISDHTSVTDILIGGLPYSSSSNNRSIGSCMYRYFTKTNSQQMNTYLGGSTSTMTLYWSFSTNTAWEPVEFQDGAQAYMDVIFTMTYRV